MIYKYFLEMDLVDYIYLTKVDYDDKADVYFPVIDMSKWSIIDSKQYSKNAKNQYDFIIEKLKKIK